LIMIDIMGIIDIVHDGMIVVAAVTVTTTMDVAIAIHTIATIIGTKV